MTRSRRPSAQTLAVLRALSESPRRWRHGYSLCQELGLKAGSMYPILIRLADRGLLDTSWEEVVDGGAPPRHRYRITRSGQRYLVEASEALAGVKQLRLRSEGA